MHLRKIMAVIWRIVVAFGPLCLAIVVSVSLFLHYYDLLFFYTSSDVDRLF